MTLRVYVAGSSGELERVESVIATLRSSPGVHILHDWTKDVRAARAAGFASDAALSDADAKSHALTDLDAVRGARVVLLLAPASPSFGAGVEFGVAIERARRSFLGVQTIVCGPFARSSIFTRLASEIRDTDAAGIAEVLRARDARGPV
jgi:hypothetical protein